MKIPGRFTREEGAESDREKVKLKKEGQVGTTIVMLGEWRCQKGDYGGKKHVWLSLHRARNYQGTRLFFLRFFSLSLSRP